MFTEWYLLLPIWKDIIMGEDTPLRQMLYLIVIVGRSCHTVACGMAPFVMCNGTGLDISSVSKQYGYDICHCI